VENLLLQLPALTREGTAIVLSSYCFNENQVDAIRSLSSENGIAHVLNSLTKKQRLLRLKKTLLLA
jgi:ATP-dependent DNA helicase RecQ